LPSVPAQPSKALQLKTESLVPAAGTQCTVPPLTPPPRRRPAADLGHAAFLVPKQYALVAPLTYFQELALCSDCTLRQQPCAWHAMQSTATQHLNCFAAGSGIAVALLTECGAHSTTVLVLTSH
jgi:hypothetical protein